MDTIQHVIDGKRAASADEATFQTIDPWAREPWAEVALGGRAEVDAALDAARRAFDEGPWPRLSPVERGAILHRLADLIEENADDLAARDTRDMGKPVSVMHRIDVPNAAENLRYFADHARLSTATTYPRDDGHHLYDRYEPAGVVAAIAPWNFPLMLGTWKVAPALAWGNTVVMKPAEQSPASAEQLALLAIEAGMPPGVLNVVHGFGPDSAGELLTTSDRIDRVTFTGESRTGAVITAAAAPNLVPVTIEAGGKGANLIFADADLDAAVAYSGRAIFSNSGQVCTSGSRIYVQAPVYEEFVARLVELADGMVLGDPRDPETQVGPLASEEQYDKVVGYLDTVPEDGGKIVTGGPADDAWMVRPTVLVDLPQDARVCRNEIFGPVVVVSRFETDEEAVSLANATRYGLSAFVHSQNVRRAHQVAHRLRAGTVWVNCAGIRDKRTPFGGFGISGIGREGGDFSREFFTEPKTVVMEI